MKKDVIRTPFPPKPTDVFMIGRFVEIVKNFLGIFKKPSKEISKTETNDSADNVEKIVQIFSEFKSEASLKSTEIEKAIKKGVDYYVEELKIILDENSERISKYSIHTKRIERQIERISKSLDGIIDNEISKKISLNDAECKNIIKMIPGAKKESAMSDFLLRIVKGALDIACAELHSTLNEIYEDVEFEIIGAVENIQQQSEQLQESFAAIDENNYEETAKNQLVDAYYLSEVSDMVMELL